MGVTTIVAGNCGASAVDVGSALQHVERTGVAINFATLVGHNSVRQGVLGAERRPPTPEELGADARPRGPGHGRRCAGALHGARVRARDLRATDELVALAKVAAAAGGLYASHMRDEGPTVDEAIAEAIGIGEAAGCPVQISHLKIDSPSVWGRAAHLLALIDRARGARSAGPRRSICLYRGQHGSGRPLPVVGARGWRGGRVGPLSRTPTPGRASGATCAGCCETMGAADYAFAVVASYRPDPSRNGLSIVDIARRTRQDTSLDAQLDVMREMLQAGGAQMVYHVMGEQDVRRIMRHPQVAVASDASVNTPGVGRPHPRGYGNTVRVLGKYVREERVLPLGEAVRKMSALPAEHFGFANRGRVREGYAADLVVFDPRLVTDRATFEEPHAFPGGLPHVLVNGVFVVRDSTHTGLRPGSVVRLTRRPANVPVPSSESRAARATPRRIS